MRPAALLLILACSSPARLPADARGASRPDHYDIRIVHGEVIDGTGAPRVRADVGIRGDSIAAIGDLSAATSDVTIDAANQVVTPGFIDLLGHSESSVLIDPHLEGKIRQGVTTELTGEGHSPGPLDDAMIAEMNRTRPPGFPVVSWRSLADFMKVVEARGSAINFAFFIGAANPREIVLGTADRPPSAAELQRMEAIVDESMKAGAVGMSTALIYPPGRFATTGELIAMGRAVRKMTSLAASRAGFTDRGILRPGLKADVVVFDPKTIRDVSTYEDPHHYSEGISSVVVNGKEVLRKGVMTGALPGKVLRRGKR